MEISETDRNRTVQQWKEYTRSKTTSALMSGVLVGAGIVTFIVAMAFFLA